MSTALRIVDDLSERVDPAFRCAGVEVRLTGASGPKTVLAGLDLSIARGEFVCIVGGSGTGKTTLLRALGGFVQPTEGVIFYEGNKTSGPPPGVVTVFQDYANALLPWRTVRRNVALPIEDSMSRQQAAERIEQVLRLVGLDKVGDEYPSRLSGGMQQRLQIARALALRPRVLLMDEPFGALDAMTKAHLQDQLLDIKRQTETTVVFITHDVDEAVYLGDRVLVAAGSPGRIAADITISLPRPRDQIRTKELSQFLQARHQVFEALTRKESSDGGV
jgi:NitT/TauT family transport system ATP-binding protein